MSSHLLRKSRRQSSQLIHQHHQMATEGLLHIGARLIVATRPERPGFTQYFSYPAVDIAVIAAHVNDQAVTIEIAVELACKRIDVLRTQARGDADKLYLAFHAHKRVRCGFVPSRCNADSHVSSC